MSGESFLKALLIVTFLIVFGVSACASIVSGRGVTSSRAESLLVPPLR